VAVERRPRDRSRLLWTTCAAIVAHAATYASFGHLDASAGIAPPVPYSATELEVEVDDLTSVPSHSLESAERAESPSHPEPARVVSETQRGNRTQVSPDSPRSPSVESSDDGSWTFSPGTAGSAQSSGPLAGHALEATVHAGIDATLAQDRQEDARRSRLIPPFTSREIELGLAPGGGLASLGRDIARRSRVPEGSRARLQFDTDASGLVVAFRVLEVSSASFEWEEVAQAIATASHEKPAMRVPPGWRGLAITLDLSCDLRTVDGAPSRDLFDKATHLPLLRVTKARLVDVSPF
jgi:hypothetical protein